MAILSRAVRNARAITRSAEWGDSSIPSPRAGRMAGAVPGSTENAALGISTVLSCVKALHDDFKSMPFAAYQGEREGARQRIADQPLIVAEPFGPDLAPEVGLAQLVASVAMRGNGYGLVVNVDESTGLPDQLTVIHPDLIKPSRDKSGRKVFKMGNDELQAHEVVHVTGLMMPGNVAGVDVVTAQRTNLDLAWKVAEYADGFFGGGGSPSGVVSVPGPGNRKKAREVADAWETTHGGVGNSHRPAVMFGGATWQQLSVTPDNAQFLETRRFMREEICGWFSVPLIRVQAIIDNASQGGGKGLDAIDAGYVKHGLLPLARSIEIEWNRLIPGGQRTWTAFDFEQYLRADAITRAQVRQIDRVGGIRTIDEMRAPEGWAPLPDGLGADPFVPLNSNTASPAGGTDNAPAAGGQQ